ncbi:MAG TPA: hypothetical protein VFU23_00625 [Gemmatimonadales bacterium]|nr:hypothetical protein [Gemmatimonadales bacterium]
MSWLALVALATAIHVDWHFARPHHMRLSLEWGSHWLLAIPVFALAAWFLASRFPDRLPAASALTLLGAVLAGQILEPMAENLSDGALSLAMPGARWTAFAQFMAAGLVTYPATVAWIARKRRLTTE